MLPLIQLDGWEKPSKLPHTAEKIMSYLSLVQKLEDNCPIHVRSYNHGTSWDSGQVAGSPLCHISCVAIAAQKLKVLGAKLLGPRRKASSCNQTECAYGTDIRWS